MSIKQIASTVLITFFYFFGWGQKIILVKTCDSDYEFRDSILTVKRSQQETLNNWVSALIEADYLEAEIDSIISVDKLTPNNNSNDNSDNADSDTLRAYVHIGPQYTFDDIKMDSIDEDLLKRLDITVPNSSAAFLSARKRLRDYYGDNGFPFAKMRIKDFSLEKGKVIGHLEVDQGHRIILDSLILHGDVKIRNGYLRNYLQLFQGETYNHSKIEKVTQKLENLSFLKVEKDPALSFNYDYASLNLYLKPQNASRFDLIFGVIPTTALGAQSLFLSLDFKAEMKNKLGYGEYIYFNFEKLRPEQQRLEFKFNYPYILDMPLAVDLDFSILRNSTNFQTVESELGVSYLLNSSDYVKVSWVNESSRLIGIDTAAVLNNGLPEALDIKQTGISIEAYVSTLDYRFNPRRGTEFLFRGAAGQKKILLNSTILSLDSTAYDQRQLNTPRYDIITAAGHFIPVAQRGAIALFLKAGYRFSSQAILTNEKFQIGGHKLLRGFDEASIFTSYYGITSIEYRLLLSNNSYISFPFIDIGFIEDLDSGSPTLVSGLGGSLGIETKLGLFNFSVAVGRTPSEGYDFGRPKAHFGFVSLF